MDISIAKQMQNIMKLILTKFKQIQVDRINELAIYENRGRRICKSQIIGCLGNCDCEIDGNVIIKHDPTFRDCLDLVSLISFSPFHPNHQQVRIPVWDAWKYLG